MATVNNKDFVVKNGLVVSTTATVEGHYNSYSTSSGALVVQGGAGIAGNLYVGGTINATKLVIEYTTITTTLVTTPDAFVIENTTLSVNTQTGALTVAGGVGIGGAVNIGQTSTVAGAVIITTATIGTYIPPITYVAGTDTVITTGSNTVTVWNTSTLQSVTNRGSTTFNAIKIKNTGSSTSTTTGALVVCGGVGIGGALNVGKEANFQGTATFYNGITTQGAISAPSFNITSNAGNIVFGDGSTQNTRAGVLWTNCSIAVAAGAVGVCSCTFLQPVQCGGGIAVGDMYYDNAVGSLYILINQGCGNIQFNPIF